MSEEDPEPGENLEDRAASHIRQLMRSQGDELPEPQVNPQGTPPASDGAPDPEPVVNRQVEEPSGVWAGSRNLFNRMLETLENPDLTPVQRGGVIRHFFSQITKQLEEDGEGRTPSGPTQEPAAASVDIEAIRAMFQEATQPLIERLDRVEQNLPVELEGEPRRRSLGQRPNHPYQGGFRERGASPGELASRGMGEASGYT